MVLSNAIIVVSVFVCRQKCGCCFSAQSKIILLGACRRARRRKKKERFCPQEVGFSISLYRSRLDALNILFSFFFPAQILEPKESVL